MLLNNHGRGGGDFRLKLNDSWRSQLRSHGSSFSAVCHRAVGQREAITCNSSIAHGLPRRRRRPPAAVVAALTLIASTTSTFHVFATDVAKVTYYADKHCATAALPQEAHSWHDQMPRVTFSTWYEKSCVSYPEEVAIPYDSDDGDYAALKYDSNTEYLFHTGYRLLECSEEEKKVRLQRWPASKKCRFEIYGSYDIYEVKEGDCFAPPYFTWGSAGNHGHVGAGGTTTGGRGLTSEPLQYQPNAMRFECRQGGGMPLFVVVVLVGSVALFCCLITCWYVIGSEPAVPMDTKRVKALEEDDHIASPLQLSPSKFLSPSRKTSSPWRLSAASPSAMLGRLRGFASPSHSPDAKRRRKLGMMTLAEYQRRINTMVRGNIRGWTNFWKRPKNDIHPPAAWLGGEDSHGAGGLVTDFNSSLQDSTRNFALHAALDDQRRSTGISPVREESNNKKSRFSFLFNRGGGGNNNKDRRTFVPSTSQQLTVRNGGTGDSRSPAKALSPPAFVRAGGLAAGNEASAALHGGDSIESLQPRVLGFELEDADDDEDLPPMGIEIDNMRGAVEGSHYRNRVDSSSASEGEPMSAGPSYAYSGKHQVGGSSSSTSKHPNALTEIREDMQARGREYLLGDADEKTTRTTTQTGVAASSSSKEAAPAPKLGGKFASLRRLGRDEEKMTAEEKYLASFFEKSPDKGNFGREKSPIRADLVRAEKPDLVGVYQYSANAAKKGSLARKGLGVDGKNNVLQRNKSSKFTVLKQQHQGNAIKLKHESISTELNDDPELWDKVESKSKKGRYFWRNTITGACTWRDPKLPRRGGRGGGATPSSVDQVVGSFQSSVTSNHSTSGAGSGGAGASNPKDDPHAALHETGATRTISSTSTARERALKLINMEDDELSSLGDLDAQGDSGSAGSFSADALGADSLSSLPLEPSSSPSADSGED